MVVIIVHTSWWLLIIGMIPLIRQLNSSVAGLGSPGPSGVDMICNIATCGSD